MKRLLLCLTAVFVIAGCSSLPTVQQQFATGCAIVNGDLTVLAVSPLLSAEQQTVIATKVLPANLAICKAGAQLNVADLRTFHDSLLPAVTTIVQGLPALPEQQGILLALATFGPMVQAIIDQLIGPAPASGVTPS